MIGGFYVDGQDEFGLDFWYDDIKESVDELKPKKAEEKPTTRKTGKK